MIPIDYVLQLQFSLSVSFKEEHLEKNPGSAYNRQWSKLGHWSLMFYWHIFFMYNEARYTKGEAMNRKQILDTTGRQLII